jgi:hypothetical protein
MRQYYCIAFLSYLCFIFGVLNSVLHDVVLQKYIKFNIEDGSNKIINA